MSFLPLTRRQSRYASMPLTISVVAVLTVFVGFLAFLTWSTNAQVDSVLETRILLRERATRIGSVASTLGHLSTSVREIASPVAAQQKIFRRPPAPGCFHCPECNHYQIATGRDVAALVKKAQELRQAPGGRCAEVYASRMLVGTFTLTLGRLPADEARDVMRNLQLEGRWSSDEGFSTAGSQLSPRVFPPPCETGTVVSEPGTSCADSPPANASADGRTLHWAEGGHSCQCREDTTWLTDWEDYAACVAKCADNQSCSTKCLPPG